MIKEGKQQLRAWAELSLWLFGGICITTVAFAQLAGALVQRDAVDSFRDPTPAIDQSLWSESRIEHYETAITRDNDKVALGILSVPSIDLEVAIFEGTSARTLNLGIGRVAGTAQIDEPDNLALAGHRDGFFRGLKDIQVGDELILETGQSEKRYKVSELLIVEPEDVYVLEQLGEPMITLITCYPFYVLGHAPKRFIVRAELQTTFIQS